MNVREHLQAVYDKHGRLTPALVVDEWRDPDHPAHVALDWNNETAAEAHRIDQARRLIQSVRVVRREDPDRKSDVRYYQSVRMSSGYEFVPTEKVVQDPFMTKLVLSDMERDWKQLKSRYEAFAEFWHMVKGDAGEATAA